MFADSTILAWQLVAAVFMATDYFFDEPQRGQINATIATVIRPVQERIDGALDRGVEYVATQWAKILVCAAFLALAWVGSLALPKVAGHMAPWMIAVTSIGLMGLLAGAGPSLATIVAVAAVHFSIAAPLRLVTSFLLRCPKGTIFGVGFLALLVSFACRFANLR